LVERKPQEMKSKLQGVLLMIAMTIGIFIPVALLGVGVILLVFNESALMIKLFLIYLGVLLGLWCLSKLLDHPYTKTITNVLIWVVVAAFVVHSFMTHTSSGCRQTRYVDCN